eukprot:6448537-Prymnesium_polylepis.1
MQTTRGCHGFADVGSGGSTRRTKSRTMIGCVLHHRVVRSTSSDSAVGGCSPAVADCAGILGPAAASVRGRLAWTSFNASSNFSSR